MCLQGLAVAMSLQVTKTGLPLDSGQSRCCLQVLEDITVPRRDSAITAWVNAIFGCNEKCTYCVVPFTR